MRHPVSDERKKLRKQLRETRRALNPSQQRLASQQLARKLRTHPVFLRSKHIALYMADDGEIDMRYVINTIEKMGKQCYLPILHPLKHNILWFGSYRNGDILMANRFGLAEPPCDKKIFPAWALDLVLMPLVGFDRKGNRLGMGGGFYDRTFSFKKNFSQKKESHQKNTRRPKFPTLMGVAHHCQELTQLSNESWDVQLDYIVTDKEIITVR